MSSRSHLRPTPADRVRLTCIGRFDPCQGEGRGFESRRPLGNALPAGAFFQTEPVFAPVDGPRFRPASNPDTDPAKGSPMHDADAQLLTLFRRD